MMMFCTVLRAPHDTHREHEQRERHDGVGDARDDLVGPAAEEAGRDTASPPIRNTSATENTAMMKSSRVAATTRLNTSRPSWSVPNQCAREGGLSDIAVLLASGS